MSEANPQMDEARLREAEAWVAGERRRARQIRALQEQQTGAIRREMARLDKRKAAKAARKKARKGKR